MKGWRSWVSAVVAGLILLIAASWVALYPSLSDAKNIEYVLWKHHLFPMNVDAALGTMIGDASRDKLVLGETEGQLQGRFGYLLPPTRVSEYLRKCYAGSAWSGKHVLFLRDSPWMVVFEGDRATELVLIKGC